MKIAVVTVDFGLTHGYTSALFPKIAETSASGPVVVKSYSGDKPDAGFTEVPDVVAGTKEGGRTTHVYAVAPGASYDKFADTAVLTAVFNEIVADAAGASVQIYVNGWFDPIDNIMEALDASAELTPSHVTCNQFTLPLPPTPAMAGMTVVSAPVGGDVLASAAAFLNSSDAYDVAHKDSAQFMMGAGVGVVLARTMAAATDPTDRAAFVAGIQAEAAAYVAENGGVKVKLFKVDTDGRLI